MKRATLIYIAMTLVFGLGLWLVLVFGARLQAPPDLEGMWRVSAVQNGTGAQTGAVTELRIEQSGVFVRIAFDGAPFRDFTLQINVDPPVIDDGGRIKAILHGQTISLRVIQTQAGSLVLEWEAPDAALTYRARRVPGLAAHVRHDEPADVVGVERPGGTHPVFLLIAQLATIILLARVLGFLATFVGQPRVVGEMIAGLMLGPSLLGWVFPSVSAALFPEHSIPFLGLLAQLGVVFFLFIVGLELDTRFLRGRGHTAGIISQGSIMVPFLLGAILTLMVYEVLFQELSPPSPLRFASVALFMGAAMSITAFPVLARIVAERNLHRTTVGAVAITCAAVSDALAWCMLAFVVAMAQAAGFAQAGATTLLAVLYVLVMLFAVRPFLARVEAYYDRHGRLTGGVLGVIVIVVLCSALATEAIGIHALFGAFMAGVIMPKGGRFVRAVINKLEDFTVIILLPIFFALTGLMTRVDLINTPQLWGFAALVIGVACAGKFGGSLLAALASGLKWREASAIGILMNTRGLMELVILNIGRELGVITDAVFAMMVLMALVTTFLTTPVLNLIYPDRVVRARPVSDGSGRAHSSILIPVSLPRSSRGFVRMADLISGHDTPERRVIGLHLLRAEEHHAYAEAAGRPAELSEALRALRTSAEEIGLPFEHLSFVSRDPAPDIVQVARETGSGLILMGFHKPIIGTAILGGTVHRVLEQATTDVAIFVDRGLADQPRTILVPYLGGDHDRLALELAAVMGRNAKAAVTVLHLVPPRDDVEQEDRDRLHARTLTDQVFADPTQPSPVTFKVVESGDPITAVLEESKPYDLVLIGVSEQWGLTSQLFGWRAERIARDCPTSMLIVRARPGKA